jgi:hypothetical protein
MEQRILLILEISIISNAPLGARLLETTSVFQKCQSAPFRAFWGHDQTDQEQG